MILIKFGEEQYMEELRLEGKLFLNTQDYFQKADGQVNREDKFEGLSSSSNGKEGRFFMGVEDGPKDEMFGVTDFKVWDGKHVLNNIFCLYKLNANTTALDPRILTDPNWKTYVLFEDGEQLLRRIHFKLMQLNKEYKLEPVEYINFDDHNGPVGDFRKSNKLEYQNEYRLVVKTGLRKPCFITLGSLTDISEMGDVSTLSLRSMFNSAA